MSKALVLIGIGWIGSALAVGFPTPVVTDGQGNPSQTHEQVLAQIALQRQPVIVPISPTARMETSEQYLESHSGLLQLMDCYGRPSYLPRRHDAVEGVLRRTNRRVRIRSPGLQ